MENQGVWLWAADPGADDPQVYERANEHDRPWEPTGVPMSTFLVHVAVFEAIWNARFGAAAAWITKPQLDEIPAPLAPIPRTAWRWPGPGHQPHAGDGLLALAGPNPGPGESPESAQYSEVFIAARAPEALGYLETLDDVDWDWASWAGTPG